MSSRISSEDQATIDHARSHADYLVAEVEREFRELTAPGAQIDHKAIAIYEKKWRKGCRPVEDLLFSLSLSPDRKACAEAVTQVRDNLHRLIAERVEVLRRGAEGPVPVEPSNDERQRAREERQARIDRYLRGEKPQE